MKQICVNSGRRPEEPGRGRPFHIPCYTARRPAVPDVFGSGGVRENKLSLPQGDGGQRRAPLGELSHAWWIRRTRRLPECEFKQFLVCIGT